MKMKGAPNAHANFGGIEYKGDADGIVEMNPVHVEIARSHGYVNAPAAAPAADADADDEVVTSADDMKRSEITAYIKANKLDVPANAKLDVQRAAVQAHMDAAAVAAAKA